MKVLIIGSREGSHIGGCLERAARVLGVQVRVLESRLASEAPAWLRRLNWWFRDRRPTWLGPFSRKVLAACDEWRPDYLIATGIAPLDKSLLRRIEKLGIRKLNYLTDDPWNPAHRARWFMESLPFYDQIFSTRRSNLDSLRAMGCKGVSYLPFAYAPELHYPDPPKSQEERTRLDSDIVFVGGGDRDRIPYIQGLIKSGFQVALYGGFWNRFRETRAFARGEADAWTYRKAIGGAKVALGLVRRANRDGNSMRSFEIPAMGGCMLTEDTLEHREIFGANGEAVAYFRSISEMLEKFRWLLGQDEERRRLSKATMRLVAEGRNTYKDRLATMLDGIS